MRYKVGDKVRIRKDLKFGLEYGDRYVTAYMEKFSNKVVTIKYVGEDYYGIEEDDYCDWTDEMIEGLAEENKPKLKLIDILNKIANGGLKEGTKVNLIADNYLTKLYYDGIFIKFVSSDNIYAFTSKDINDEDEYELIEPDHFPDVGKMAETTDNTKIEELDKEEMLCLTLQCAIAVLTDKLNEVIRKINRGE